MIYFDNASTTIIDKTILKTYQTILSTYFANPSGAHALSRDVFRLQDKSRTEILKSLDYKDGKVIFTSGATEANNLALIGLYRQYKSRGNEIIISAFEHPSIAKTCDYLAKEEGAVIRVVPVNSHGKLDTKVLEKMLSPKTVIVSLIAVNNEVGAINTFHEIKQMLVNYPKVIFHSDITQALGKVMLDYNLFDAFSFSAHKIHGLKGSGALVLHKRLNLAPLLHGGAQEEGMRAGTSNAPSNIVLAQTVRLAQEGITVNYKHVQTLANALHDYLERVPEHFVLNSTRKNPYIVNFSLLKVKASLILNGLENKNIYVGTTSSCSAKLHEPSHSVLAITGNEERAHNAIRVSFSYENTLEEVDQFFNALMTIIKGVHDE